MFQRHVKLCRKALEVFALMARYGLISCFVTWLEFHLIELVHIFFVAERLVRT